MSRRFEIHTGSTEGIYCFATPGGCLRHLNRNLKTLQKFLTLKCMKLSLQLPSVTNFYVHTNC